MQPTYAELAAMIDHSLLHPTLTDAELAAGCELAARYRVAAVCLKPYAVPQAQKILAGTSVQIGCVIGFPHGNSTTAAKCFETAEACLAGATEIDMVINIGKALGGDFAYVEQEVHRIAATCHEHQAILKVIFENDYLPDDAVKIELCKLCERARADYVKTSSGYGFVKDAQGHYGYQGATEHDLKLMRAHCSPKVKLKAAGGVRTLDQLIRVRELGCDRCGLSATQAILDEYNRRAGA